MSENVPSCKRNPDKFPGATPENHAWAGCLMIERQRNRN